MFILSISLVSCQDEPLVNQDHEFPEEVWLAADTVSFPFTVYDTVKPYDLYIALRHSTDYPFMNLFMFVSTHFPGQAERRDTIEFILSEPSGEWIGKGFGRLKYNEFLVRKGLVFPDTGQYSFVFVQAMRIPDVKGIRDIGIQIKESQ